MVLKKKELSINMGPQHPATHGVLRLVLELDAHPVRPPVFFGNADDDCLFDFLANILLGGGQLTNVIFQTLATIEMHDTFVLTTPLAAMRRRRPLLRLVLNSRCGRWPDCLGVFLMSCLPLMHASTYQA